MSQIHIPAVFNPVYYVVGTGNHGTVANAAAPDVGRATVMVQPGSGLPEGAGAKPLSQAGVRFSDRSPQSPPPSVVDRVFAQAADISHLDYRVRVYCGLARNSRFTDVPRVFKALEFNDLKYRCEVAKALASSPHFSNFAFLHHFMDEEKVTAFQRLFLYEEMLRNPNFKDVGLVWDFIVEHGQELARSSDEYFYQLWGALVRHPEFKAFDQVLKVIKEWDIFKENPDASNEALAALPANPNFSDFRTIFDSLNSSVKFGGHLQALCNLAAHPQFQDFERLTRLISQVYNFGQDYYMASAQVYGYALQNPGLRTVQQFQELRFYSYGSRESGFASYIAKREFTDFDAVLTELRAKKIRSDEVALEVLVVLSGLARNPGFSAFDDVAKLMSACEHHLGSNDVVKAFFSLYKALAVNPHFTDFGKIFGELKNGDWSALYGDSDSGVADVLVSIAQSAHFDHWAGIQEFFGMPGFQDYWINIDKVLRALAENKTFQNFAPVVDYTINGDHGVSPGNQLWILNDFARNHPEADRFWFRNFVDGIEDEKLKYAGWARLAGIADASLSDEVFEKVKNCPDKEIQCWILAEYAANPKIIHD